MKVKTNRITSFSDGVIAIIITIMALNIPLPAQYDTASILQFLYSILIFFVSFIIVGSQWNKHRFLFDRNEEVVSKIVWLNLLYLFVLSLMPIFTKWIMEHPQAVMPAIGYDMVFILVNICYQAMFHMIMKTSSSVQFRQAAAMQSHHKLNRYRRLFLMLVGIVLLLILTWLLPGISIVFFIALPVISIGMNLVVEDIDKRGHEQRGYQRRAMIAWKKS